VKRLALSFVVLAYLGALAPLAAAASDDTDLGFESAFPRKIYQKKYFGLAFTGVTVVAAGALTYFTAGAGAPAAATGVSTVASWVAGGEGAAQGNQQATQRRNRARTEVGRHQPQHCDPGRAGAQLGQV
jgi:hypothetical protein